MNAGPTIARVAGFAVRPGRRGLARCLALSLLFAGSPPTRATPAETPAQPPLEQRLVDQAVASCLERFGAAPTQLQSNQLAVTLVNLKDTNRPIRASYRGDVQIYPASVIKLFYLAATHRWLEDGRLEDTAELRRALRDMIVESYNEATHYVVDLLTGTTSGPELPDAELAVWFDKRNAVNRYFNSLGYRNVVANKKPWCEGPYGRESQSIRTQKPNRNMLSTDDTARLLVEIATRRCITPARSDAMLELLKRNPARPLDDEGGPSQDSAFTGLALRDFPGARLWSKAGLTSQVRHDAAYVELPGGARLVLVVYTEGHASERGLIEAISRTVIRGLNQP